MCYDLRIMKFSRIIAFVLIAYSLCVAVGVESINSQEEGGILQNWHRSQREEFPGGCCGSGQGKMRIHGEFQGFLGAFGVWVYPACAYSAFAFIKQARHIKSGPNKKLYVFCAALCFVILARFFWLGVFSAGAGIG
jgi:hypothetical protein